MRKKRKLTEEHKRKIGKTNSIVLRGRHLSEKHKKKISESTKGKNKGRVFTEEHKKKISLSCKGLHRGLGKQVSEETKRKLSNILKGRHLSEETKRKMRGRWVSEETRQKLSERHKGKIKSEEHRRKLAAAIKGRKRLDLIGKNNHQYGKSPTKGAGQGHGCYYESPLQGKIWLRSSYELAYAKWLDSQKILWYYEIETFDLGDTTYTPDFFLPRDERFIEVKGYMSKLAQEKINKFKEEYPWNLDILYKEDLIKLEVIVK